MSDFIQKVQISSGVYKDPNISPALNRTIIVTAR